MVKVSIIIPTYNVEKYINQTLDSVLTQTFDDFEVICVNDGSKDNTLSILHKRAEEDKRIKIINQQNSGVSKSRNNAFSQATGKYIYYMDSDDMIHPQLLEICYHLAEKNNADVISFSHKEFFDGDNPDFEKISEDEISLLPVDDVVSKITAKGDIKINYSIWSKFFKKDILKDISFDEEISIAEDALYTFSVAKKNPRAFILTDKLYGYRICKKSLSHGNYNVKQIIEYSKCVEKVVELYSDDSFHLEILKRDFIPNILKHQIGRCRRADKQKRPAMRQEFARQLNYLNSLNMLDKKYHKKKRWKFISLLLNNKIYELSFLGMTLFSIDINNKIRFGK